MNITIFTTQCPLHKPWTEVLSSCSAEFRSGPVITPHRTEMPSVPRMVLPTCTICQSPPRQAPFPVLPKVPRTTQGNKISLLFQSCSPKLRLVETATAQPHENKQGCCIFQEFSEMAIGWLDISAFPQDHVPSR